MDLKEGDLVITLEKVESVKGILGEVKAGMTGVITATSSKFNKSVVYGVLINGREYFLFPDEIQKLEDEC